MAQTADRDWQLPPAVLQRAAATFGLLASTMRLHIVWLLAQGESDVGTLAERTGGTLQAVSQHLAKLKLAGLVESRREGRRHVPGDDHPPNGRWARGAAAHPGRAQGRGRRTAAARCPRRAAQRRPGPA